MDLSYDAAGHVDENIDAADLLDERVDLIRLGNVDGVAVDAVNRRALFPQHRHDGRADPVPIP